MKTQTSNALYNAIMEAGGKDRPPMLAPGSTETTTERYMENYKNVSQDIRDQLNAEAEAVQIILTGIDNDIYSTVDACPNACEMWKPIKRLKQGESINVQDLATNLYWEFGKFTSRDGESLDSYYSRSQQADTRNRGKAIVNSPSPINDQEPTMVAEDDEMDDIDDEPDDHELEAHYMYMAQIQERDDTDDEPDDHELEAHYMYMAQIQEVTPDATDNSRPIFDSEPLQKVPNNDNYNVFAIESEHPEQSNSVNDTYPIEQDERNVIIGSLDMSYDREQPDQDDDDDLANERDFLACLIKKLKCEIDDSKNRNKFLETSNKALVDKLKGEIEDFKTKNKSLESSNNHFKEANNELSKTNQLMFKDLKKFQAKLNRYHDVKYASKVEIDYTKAKGDLMSYKMVSQKSSNEYTRKINELNQTISDMKKELFAHQETISIMLQEKAAHIKFYKTREDKEIDKVIALENKVKVLDNIVYKTGQSVQTMNMLNRNFKTSFAKPEFLEKAQRANLCLYDIGVISSTSVSRPQLKSNQMEDRVMLNNSQGKKQEVEDHRRNVKFSKNKTSTKMPMAVPISTREPKRIVNQSVATPLRRKVASESTNQNPSHTTRKLYEHVSKTCSWWYCKFTPPGYKWKPKFQIENVNPNVSMPLGNASRTANILEPM
nr:hypothetical protein [Tanacetum cinerariifolium]